MNRVLVMASSSGAGKSTFARRLGEQFGLPVYHLDVLFWKPGWVESSTDEFAAAQLEVVKKPTWIIEGNYTDTYPLRQARADTLIYLDVSLGLSLWRVVARRVRYRQKTRPDMASGCPEKLDPSFLWFILRTYHSRRHKMPALLEQFRQSGGTVIILHGAKEQDAFLAKRPLDGHF